MLTIAAGLLAAEPALVPGDERYVVVLQRGAKGMAEAVREAGGKLDVDLGDRLVVTASAAAIEKLRGQPTVRYVQKAVFGVVETPADRMETRATAIHAPVQSDTTLTWTSGDYSYDGAGNIAGIGTATAPGTQGYRTYGYDSVTRLKKAEIGVTPAVTYEYNYDVYGNRTADVINAQSVTVPVSPTNNRLTNATYDASGNQLTRGTTAATYDGFDMVTSYQFDGQNVETFVYTANDERIGVLRGTDWTWSLRHEDGKVLRQYRSSSTNPAAPWLWIEDYVCRDGLLLGSERVAEEGGRRHYHLDHLASARLVTGATGSVISEHDFLPFGGERTMIGQHLARGFDREEPMRFTGHERDFDNTTPNDSSAYIDYMHARYYAPGAGRFLSVDPVSGELSQPQSWNRYAYALNNPLKYVDATGMDETAFVCDENGDHCYYETTQPEPTDEEYVEGLTDWETWSLSMAWLADRAALALAEPMMNVLQGMKNDNPTQFASGALVIGAAGVGLGLQSGISAPLPTLLQSNIRSIGTASLAEQLTLAEAMAGAGKRIMTDGIKDPSYPPALFAKMQHAHKLPNGKNITVHYWLNLASGARFGFKFK